MQERRKYVRARTRELGRKFVRGLKHSGDWERRREQGKALVVCLVRTSVNGGTRYCQNLYAL